MIKLYPEFREILLQILYAMRHPYLLRFASAAEFALGLLDNQLTESDRYQQIYRHRLVRVDSEGEAVTKGYNILRFVGCVVIAAIHFLQF